MSLLNKYMHPRNIYRTPPNFKELAISFPDFRSYAKQDITGKVLIDFKDQATLRALTTTLLKKDFGLSVEIPLNRLVPTLPLRLNYLLWIEDLMVLMKDSREGPIRGIDIGTGASSIYSLLAAKSNKWHMLATEVDAFSLECAKRNVQDNNLQNLVTVVGVAGDTVLQGALEDEVVYDFCMCNPPFFSTEQELEASSKSRSARRPLPHNARTGAIGEIVTDGGEVALVTQMIRESKQLTNKVRIYTSMVGQKSSLGPLKHELSTVAAASVTQTEFCQGHTTRWGLAWTFINNVNLESSKPQICSRKQIKKKPPLKYIVPNPCSLAEYTVTCASVRLQELLSQLKMKCEQVTDNKHMKSYCVTAFENTWSHQRRKRRENSAQSDSLNETQNLDDNLAGKTEVSEMNLEENPPKRRCEGDDVKQEEPLTKRSKTMKNVETIELGNDKPKRSKTMEDIVETVELGNGKPNRSKTMEEVVEKVELGNREPVRSKTMEDIGEPTPLLKAMLVMKKVSSEINVELSWIKGGCGREAVHQVLQYLKNNLK